MSADEERQAILGLALATLPNEDEVRAALFSDEEREPPRLAEALQTLGRLTDEGTRMSHRVLSLDLLAKVPRRRGLDPLAEAEAELYAFVESAVDEGERIGSGELGELSEVTDEPVVSAALEADEVPPPLSEPRSDDPRVNLTVRALQTISMIPTEEHHWRTFTRVARQPLQLTDAEVDRPLCTDEEKIPTPYGRDAVRTAVWFWSDRPAKDFEAWTDPRTWDKSCHLFFKSVVQKAGTAISATVPEFRATFTETVNIDGTNTLSTDLVFSRSVHTPDLYALEFDLPAPLPSSPPILVDTGQVTVREDPLAPPARRTALLAEKYILFADPAYDTWPTLACDLFWTEFAITMALGCS